MSFSVPPVLPSACTEEYDQQQYEGKIFVQYPCSENASFPSGKASPASPGLTPISPCGWVDINEFAGDDGVCNDTDDDDDD